MINILFILIAIWLISKSLSKSKKEIDNNFLPLPTFNNQIKMVSDKKEELVAILKEPTFDSNKIVDYNGEEYKKFEFRPQTFNQFIGQEEAKEKAKVIIAQAKKNIKSHVILSACKGMGKPLILNY